MSGAAGAAMDTITLVGRIPVEDGGVTRRLASLETENRHLRALLIQAHRQADAELLRNARLGQIVASERDASRAEAERIRAESEALDAKHRIDLADRSARLADAEELNLQLRASEEFNRRILWTSTDCVKVLDLDGRMITVSANGPAMFGVANHAALIGQPWAAFWSAPESRAAVKAALDAARAGRPRRFQARLGRGGAETWWDIAVTPIDGADGRPERILAVSRDITELKQNEDRQTLLMQELAHRVKNTLAMVQAISAQTLRNADSLAAAGEALGARLFALARAHEVLLQGSWSSAGLADLVGTAVTLHGGGEPGRFAVSGPDLTLAARTGLTLALMLHELGTNAAKYGALSTPAGRVAITWEVAGPEEARRFRFRWEESGGPPVTPPARSGFGSRLIQRSLAYGVGGSAHLAYPETGVVLTLDAPLSGLVAG
ncbi:sensor histidine kinase [Methylobacterium dankookense]|uniref:Blue-light-activated histidine kinase n=1 Tax=Methylobacterium dankookense TaxID=560405 RepID=A0A564G4Q8_9HYPH|nr:HWE histidine kinase domain-containing protein [Methylobacterium dankookense]GJD56501.1 Blue-light-activated histidine kinase [Methylobacterium dankookense]VUF15297.1 Blue-light-activated histidine kinase [Methylobacterium dankookense]